jgi:hypothetical protein
MCSYSCTPKTSGKIETPRHADEADTGPLKVKKKVNELLEPWGRAPGTAMQIMPFELKAQNSLCQNIRKFVLVMDMAGLLCGCGDGKDPLSDGPRQPKG